MDLIENIKTKIKLKVITLSDIRALIKYIYVTPIDNLLNETNSIFYIIRMIIIVGIPFLIHPVLGIIVFFIDRVIEEKINEKHFHSLIEKMENEITLVNKEIRLIHQEMDKHKSNAIKFDELKAQAKNMNAYKQQLSSNLSRVRHHYNEIIAYKQKAKKYEESQMIMKNKELANKKIIILNYHLNELCNLYCNHLIKEEVLADVTHHAKRVIDTLSHTDKTLSTHVDTVADAVSGRLKNNEIGKLRSEILHGHIKLSSIFKFAIITGTVFAINHYVAVIGAIIWLLRRGYLKEQQKHQLKMELHEEMEIVEEKIKDAAHKDDLKKKYQYIRLRREIKKQMDKLDYGMEIVRPNVTSSGGGGSDFD